MRNRSTELFPNAAGNTPEIIIEPSLGGNAHTLIAGIGFADKRILLVSDSNTYAVLGKRILGELAALSPRHLMLAGNPAPDLNIVKKIHDEPCDAIIAIGSGTINDLCKYAAFLGDKPYAVFPTAPSMNGYLSTTASILTGGIKESHIAQVARAIFCDLQVIASAPPRLIRSGLGDSLCRPTAQADWLLSHLVLNTAYDPLPFELLKPYEVELFAHSNKLTKGDPHIIELLLRTLLVSGWGMTLAKGSYPASQGEHMIAHTMEMKHANMLPHTYHGEQIGVTTLTMAQIQENLLLRPLQLPPLPAWEGALASYFGRTKAQHIAEITRKKYERYDAMSERLQLIEKEIRDRLREVTLPTSFLRNVLEQAGAPTTPSELGWNEDNYIAAISHAALTRDRFGFLDLVPSNTP